MILRQLRPWAPEPLEMGGRCQRRRCMQERSGQKWETQRSFEDNNENNNNNNNKEDKGLDHMENMKNSKLMSLVLIEHLAVFMGVAKLAEEWPTSQGTFTIIPKSKIPQHLGWKTHHWKTPNFQRIHVFLKSGVEMVDVFSYHWLLIIPRDPPSRHWARRMPCCWGWVVHSLDATHFGLESLLCGFSWLWFMWTRIVDIMQKARDQISYTPYISFFLFKYVGNNSSSSSASRWWRWPVQQFDLPGPKTSTHRSQVLCCGCDGLRQGSNWKVSSCWLCTAR